MEISAEVTESSTSSINKINFRKVKKNPALEELETKYTNLSIKVKRGLRTVSVRQKTLISSKKSGLSPEKQILDENCLQVSDVQIEDRACSLRSFKKKTESNSNICDQRKEDFTGLSRIRKKKLITPVRRSTRNCHKSTSSKKNTASTQSKLKYRKNHTSVIRKEVSSSQSKQNPRKKKKQCKKPSSSPVKRNQRKYSRKPSDKASARKKLSTSSKHKNTRKCSTNQKHTVKKRRKSSVDDYKSYLSTLPLDVLCLSKKEEIDEKFNFSFKMDPDYDDIYKIDENYEDDLYDPEKFEKLRDLLIFIDTFEWEGNSPLKTESPLDDSVSGCDDYEDAPPRKKRRKRRKISKAGISPVLSLRKQSLCADSDTTDEEPCIIDLDPIQISTPEKNIELQISDDEDSHDI